MFERADICIYIMYYRANVNQLRCAASSAIYKWI